MLKLVISLSRIGDQILKNSDIIEQTTTLMAACYGQPQSSTMTEVGRSSGLASKHLTTPKLCSLPSTTDAFILHVKRAHLQL